MSKKHQPGCPCCRSCELCYDAELPGNKAVQATIGGVQTGIPTTTNSCPGGSRDVPAWMDINGTYALPGPWTGSTTCHWIASFDLTYGGLCGCDDIGDPGPAWAQYTIEVFGIGTSTLWVYLSIYAVTPDVDLRCVPAGTGHTNALFIFSADKEEGVWECADLETGIECTFYGGSTPGDFGVDFSTTTIVVEFPASQPSPTTPITPLAYGIAQVYSVTSGTARVVVTLPWPDSSSTVCIEWGLQYWDGSTWQDFANGTEYIGQWQDSTGDIDAGGGIYEGVDLQQSAIADAADDDLDIRLAYREWYNCAGSPGSWNYGSSTSVTVWDGSTNCADYHERDPDVC